MSCVVVVLCVLHILNPNEKFQVKMPFSKRNNNFHLLFKMISQWFNADYRQQQMVSVRRWYYFQVDPRWKVYVRTQSSKRYVRLSVRIPYLLDKYFHNVTKSSNFIQFLKKIWWFFQSGSSLRCFRTSKYHQKWPIFWEKYRNYLCTCQSENLF